MLPIILEKNVDASVLLPVTYLQERVNVDMNILQRLYSTDYTKTEGATFASIVIALAVVC